MKDYRMAMSAWRAAMPTFRNFRHITPSGVVFTGKDFGREYSERLHIYATRQLSRSKTCPATQPKQGESND